MQYDVIILGGSFAGLSAAIYLARARRSVCIVDSGKPRNRFADHSHGFFAHDGSRPQDMINVARAQVTAYPSVTTINGEAVDAWRDDSGITIALDSGAVHTSSKLLLAFGVSDILPSIDGLADRWGKSVLHCPYCHGYEFSGQQLGVLQLSPLSAHQAMLISEWGPTTFFLNDGAAPDEATLNQLLERNVSIESRPVRALAGDGPRLTTIQLEDGTAQPLDALFIGPSQYLNSPIAEQLGCELTEGPLGVFIKVDEMKATSIPNVFAAGDVTRGGGHTVAFASADGVMAGLALHRALVFGGEL
jgi:thioredoxin reductase